MKFVLLTLTFFLVVFHINATPIEFSASHSGIKKQKHSQCFTDTLYSKSFGTNRLLTVYLPKSFKKNRTYPVVYMADGQLLIESYVKSIDSLIEIKAIPDIVVIGVHSNETLVPGQRLEYRNYEYIKDLGGGGDSLNLLFDKHFEFFTKEVVEYAQENYSVSSKKEDCTFYGISNGSDFGVTLAEEKPELIGNYILCSIVSGSKVPFEWTSANCPNFFLATGDQEDVMIREEAKRLGEYLTKISKPYELVFYHGGHERKKWEVQFISTLPEIYGKKTK